MDQLMVGYKVQLLQSLVVVLVLSLVRVLVYRAISRLAARFHLDSERVRMTRRVTHLTYFSVLGLFLIGIWGLESKDLLFFVSSTLTVLGIGFFAQWSILSNITAGIVLFFYHPVKLGDQIRIYDKEYDVEGELQDISVFFMHIRTPDGRKVTIPNNIALQKTVLLLSSRSADQGL
jgi:small-conductance mechanosensitive channel